MAAKNITRAHDLYQGLGVEPANARVVVDVEGAQLPVKSLDTGDVPGVLVLGVGDGVARRGTSLIGPAPVVQSPKFVGPFKAVGRMVTDANSRNIAEVFGGDTTQEDRDLAKVFKYALNAYFEAKES